MKLISLLWLSTPLVTAILDSRQAAGIPDSCSSICGMAALVDSTTQPRCDLSDAACLCADNGWSTSVQHCLAEICPSDTVQPLYKSWYDQCAFLGATLSSAPSITGSITLQSIPGPVSTATAFSSIQSVFQSVMGEEFDKASASYASVLSAALTQITDVSGVTPPATTSAASVTSSQGSSTAPTSAGNALMPSAVLLMSLAAMIFAF